MAGTPPRIEAARNPGRAVGDQCARLQLGSIDDRRKTLVVVTEESAGAERRRGQETLPTLDTIVRSANRANVSVYPIDPGETPRAARDRYHASVTRWSGRRDRRRTAAATSTAGLKRAVADASDYYLITYRPSQPDDGRFRGVDVRVARKGVTLRARKGYFGASPDEALRAAILARLNEPKAPAPSNQRRTPAR